MIEMNAVAAGTELDAARDAGREGVSAGWCAWSASDASLMFSLIVRPDVNMHAFHGLPFVAAMGMMDALVGTASTPGLEPAGKVGIQWPSDIVRCACVWTSLARVAVNGGAAAAGMFGAVTVDIERSALGELGVTWLTQRWSRRWPPRAGPRGRLGGCCQHAARRAGPLAPVLGEYFDMVPLLGRQVAAVSPNGLPLAVGVFAGLDIWGRATIKTDAGEQESARPYEFAGCSGAFAQR
ncbi:MAG: hypothetical protein ACLU37_05030 [Collinsella sp.]